MRSLYDYRSGYRRPVVNRIVYTAFNWLAIAGWVLAIFLLISIIFGFFDDILIMSWEATE